jgi:hypothetical protein
LDNCFIHCLNILSFTGEFLMSDTINNPEKSDTLETMPLPATGNGPSASGDADGLSILALVQSVASEKSTESPKIPLGRDGQIKRKPGRPRKMPVDDTHTDLPASPAPVKKSSVDAKASKAASDELARILVNTGVGAMSALIGDEWNFQTQDEADGMRQAVGAYINTKGNGELSPEAMLVLVIMGYSMPRIGHENTRTKLGKFFGNVWTGIKAVFKR